MEMDESDNRVLFDFKARQISGAFLCHYRNCPRAAQGFSTSELRLKHEESHRPRFQCAHAPCGFFGTTFNTRAAMKKHTIQYHDEEDTATVPDSLIKKPRSSQQDRSLFTLTEVKKKSRGGEVSSLIFSEINNPIDVPQPAARHHAQARAPSKSPQQVSHAQKRHPILQHQESIMQEQLQEQLQANGMGPNNGSQAMNQQQFLQNAAIQQYQHQYAQKQVQPQAQQYQPTPMQLAQMQQSASQKAVLERKQQQTQEQQEQDELSPANDPTPLLFAPTSPPFQNTQMSNKYNEFLKATNREDIQTLIHNEDWLATDDSQAKLEQLPSQLAQQKPKETVMLSPRNPLSDLMQVANTRHLTARSPSSATDASRIRSPFRESSQYRDLDGITHRAAAEVPQRQVPEEDARAYQAYQAEAQVQAQHRSYRHDDLNAPTASTVNPGSVFMDYDTVPRWGWSHVSY